MFCFTFLQGLHRDRVESSQVYFCFEKKLLITHWPIAFANAFIFASCSALVLLTEIQKTNLPCLASGVARTETLARRTRCKQSWTFFGRATERGTRTTREMQNTRS